MVRKHSRRPGERRIGRAQLQQRAQEQPLAPQGLNSRCRFSNFFPERNSVKRAATIVGFHTGGAIWPTIESRRGLSCSSLKVKRDSWRLQADLGRHCKWKGCFFALAA